MKSNPDAPTWNRDPDVPVGTTTGNDTGQGVGRVTRKLASDPQGRPASPAMSKMKHTHSYEAYSKITGKWARITVDCDRDHSGAAAA